MESWTENQRQPPLYDKFWTVSGRHISHKYQDMQKVPDFQQYLHERNFSHDLNRWTVPRCRTGGVLQDYTNWTEPTESYFPASPPSKSQPNGVWMQMDMERIQKEPINCSRIQMQAVKKWDSHSPLYSRTGKRSMSEASYRELEAWAARYCHSLPRKRHLETELYRTHGIQGVHERERASYWVSPCGNTDTKGIISPSVQHHHIRGWGERVNKPVSYTVPQPSILEKSWSIDRKENNPRCQQRMLDQPPLYIPPPPYSAAHNIYGIQLPLKYSIKDTISQQGETREQHHIHNYKYNTLPAPKKQEFHGVLSSKSGGSEEWKKKANTDRRQGHVDKTWKFASAHLELPADGIAQLHSPRHSEVTAEPREFSSQPPLSGKAKVNKGMGSGTVFCLVSRPGGVNGMPTSNEKPLQSYYSPELNLKPPVNIPSKNEEMSSKGYIEDIRACQPPDEFDCGKPQQQYQYGSFITEPHLQTLQSMESPAWMKKKQTTAHREELIRAIQTRPKKTVLQIKKATSKEATAASCSTVSRSPVLRKRIPECSGPSSTTFPLWKIPGDLAQSRSTPFWQCNKRSVKQQGKVVGNSQDNNQLSNSFNKHSQARTCEQQEDTSSSSSGVVVIDATCVVVRAEFILPPQKEHVQYLCTPHGVNNDFLSHLTSDNHQSDLNISALNLSTQGNEEDIQCPEAHFKQTNNKSYQNLISEVPTETNVQHCMKNHNSEETKWIHLPSAAVPVNESLQQRALRILGLSHLDSTLLETMKNTSSEEVPACGTEQSSEFSTQILHKKLQEEPEDSSTEVEKVTNFAERDFASENKCFTNTEKSTDEGPKVKSSKEDFNNLKQPVQCVCDKQIVFDATEKIDSIVTEGICNDEPLPSPQETSSNTEEIVLSPPSPANICSISPDLPVPPSRSQSPSLFVSNYSVSNKKEDLIPEQKERTTSSIGSSIPLQLPSMSDSVSSPLSHTGFCTIFGSSPDSPLSNSPLGSGPQQDNVSPPQCPSLPHVPLDPPSHFRSPLCLDIHVSALESTEMQLFSPPSESVEESCCPRALWDAVNRIRRHTAPDSDNEEDEWGEIWDNQENAGEEKEIKKEHEPEDCSEEKLKFQSQNPLVVVGNDSHSRLSNENSFLNGTEESHLLGAPEEYENDLEEQDEDDTLSWSSSDSHTSKGTVIMGQDDEVQTGNYETGQEESKYNP